MAIIEVPSRCSVCCLLFPIGPDMPCIRFQREGSKHQIWNTFGWIYDTSVAMVHIALGGVFRRYPGIGCGVFSGENGQAAEG